MANNFSMSPEAQAATDEIIATALGPKRTRTEEGTVEERPIKDLIDAINFQTQAPDEVPWGIRLARVKYGSTTG
jgi:hypothetical protein